MKGRGLFIALAVAALLLFVGGGVAVYRRLSRRENADALRAAARRYGLPEDWLVAVGLVESGLNNTATNLTGPDLARGGAWGPTQITMKTARAHGYTGNPEDLTKPAVAAELTAKIVAAGSPRSLEDVGAWWNAGRRRAEDLGTGHITKTDYIPKLQAALARARLV